MRGWKEPFLQYWGNASEISPAPGWQRGRRVAVVPSAVQHLNTDPGSASQHTVPLLTVLLWLNCTSLSLLLNTLKCVWKLGITFREWRERHDVVFFALRHSSLRGKAIIVLFSSFSVWIEEAFWRHYYKCEWLWHEQVRRWSVFNYANIEEVHVNSFTSFSHPLFIEKNASLVGWKALRVTCIPLLCLA